MVFLRVSLALGSVPMSERPDLEGYRASVAECCGDQVGERCCDYFGCSSVTELLDYAARLEREAATLRRQVALLEFSNRILPDSSALCDQDRCVNCDAMRYEGHAKRCKLAALLAGAAAGLRAELEALKPKYVAPEDDPSLEPIPGIPGGYYSRPKAAR